MPTPPRKPRCSACGRELAESESFTCSSCRESFARAQRAPGFLPTVELFTEPAAGGAPAHFPPDQFPLFPAAQGDLFMEE